MPESDIAALAALLDPLPDAIRAELLDEVRKLSIHQDDDELFKLLRILSLYAAFYQTIPEAIREVHERAIARIEAISGREGDGDTGHEERVASPLKELAEAVGILRSACPPPFEEFRANVEDIQANAANINRYGRELIVELQKNSARARRGWTAGSGSIIFTAFGSAAIGAVAVYVLMRFFSL